VSQRTVALTRTEATNTRLARHLQLAGYETVSWPALHIVAVTPTGSPLADRLTQAGTWLLVSPNAVQALHQISRGDWMKWSRRAALITQGPSTTAAITKYGLTVTAQANPPQAAGLISAALDQPNPGGTTAIICGDQSSGHVAQTLADAGRMVDVVTIYENRTPDQITYPIRPLHAVVYASPSAVNRMLNANPWLMSIDAVAIGPTTSQALAQAGHKQVFESRTPSDAGLIETIKRIPCDTNT